MASPAVDSTFGAVTNTTWVNGTTQTTTSHPNKTAGGNELMVACCSYSGTTNSISSITESSSTLSFTFLCRFATTNSNGDHETIEIWVAKITSAFNATGSNLSYTVNWHSGSGNVDGGGLVFFCVSGLNSLSAPLDPNASIPADAINATSSAVPPTVTFSTTNPDDLLIAVTGLANDTGAVGTPSSWTNVGSSSTAAGLSGQGISVDSLSVSTTQSSATYADTNAHADNSWITVVIALTADASGGGGGNPSKAACVLIGF